MLRVSGTGLVDHAVVQGRRVQAAGPKGTFPDGATGQQAIKVIVL